MLTLGFDINVFESKEQRVALKALGMFYRPSMKAWVKRIYIKGAPEAEVQAKVNGFRDKMKLEFGACPVSVSLYTEADRLKRMQYRADAGPAKIKAAPKLLPATAPVVDSNAEIKQLLTLLLAKLA